MKLFKITNQPATEDGTLAVTLLAAVGSADFAGRLMAAFQPAVSASHCTVFALRSNGRVDAISTASAVGEVASMTASDYLRMGFDRQDTNMTWLVKRKPGPFRQFWIGHQLAKDVADQQYRRLCYGETGIRERLSLLCVFPDGYRVAVNLYRNHSYPDFAAGDTAWLGARGPLIGAAVMRHVQLGPRSAGNDAVQQQLMADLSGRERQLISHMLAGLTTAEAALEMGVSATTAMTYRLRAFQHLGVRNHRELLFKLATGSLVRSKTGAPALARISR